MPYGPNSELHPVLYNDEVHHNTFYHTESSANPVNLTSHITSDWTNENNVGDYKEADRANGLLTGMEVDNNFESNYYGYYSENVMSKQQSVQYINPVDICEIKQFYDIFCIGL